MSDQPTVAQLVSELKRRVTPVAKARRADTGQFSYAYRGVDDILDVVGSLTTELGLTLSTEEIGKEKAGKEWSVTVSFTWRGPAGDSQPLAVVSGVAMNLQAAQQLAYRVALTQGLAIPLGIDEERSHPSESLGKPRKPRKPRARDKPAGVGEPFDDPPSEWPVVHATAKKRLWAQARREWPDADDGWLKERCAAAWTEWVPDPDVPVTAAAFAELWDAFQAECL